MRTLSPARTANCERTSASAARTRRAGVKWVIACSFLRPSGPASQIGLADELVVEQFRGRAFDEDPALLEDVAPARDLQRGAGVLLDQQHRDAAGGDLADQ